MSQYPQPPQGYPQPPQYPPPGYPPGYDPNFPPPGAVVYADAFPPDRRPTSVTVLAIIGIVLASITLLGAVWGVVVTSVERGLNPMNDAVRNDPFLHIWSPISTTIAILVAVMELSGSIGSLMLKAWARTTMVVYSILALVVGLVSLYVNYVHVMPITKKVVNQQLQSQGPGQFSPGFVDILSGFSVGCGVLMLSYPILVLIFFTRPRVKAAFSNKA